MQQSKYRVLGVMSGTSLDGVDLAFCRFIKAPNGSWSYLIETAETIAYTDTWRRSLEDSLHYSDDELQRFNEAYTDYLSEIIAAFIQKKGIQKLDAVCSHGHTILHQPEKGITLQIGNLPLLAQKLKQTVVCDFRVQDVALGGQGAPLVPIGDRLLFGNYDSCLNLGGFANVSFEKDGKRIAYDLCPVNVVLNHYAQKLGHPYDAEGQLAACGIVNADLLDRLNALPFYQAGFPKSLGVEWVQEQVFPILEASTETPQNILRTFTEHVAEQLARQFSEQETILVTGGGAYNQFLLLQLTKRKKLQIQIPDKTLIEFKEALVFGLLGVLRLRNEVNCLASVTGASKDHSCGIVYF